MLLVWCWDRILGRAILVWVIWIATASLWAGAQARSAPAQVAQAGEPGSKDRTITINVEVTDKSGQHIRGLKANDFTVFDNKQPQKVLSFRALDSKASPPDQVHVVIVVDAINTDFNVVARQREELAAFLKQDGGELANPTSIAVLADRGLRLERSSSRDGNVLLAALNKGGSALRIVGRDTGYYGAAERLEMSLNQLAQLAAFESAQPGRKMLLVISPGWPLLPYAGDQSDLKQRTWVFNTLVGLTNGLREGNITLYTLDPFDLGRTNPFYYQSYLKGVAFAKDATYPNLALQVLAEHSGGEVLTTGRDITGELNTAVRDANASYELSFEAAPSTGVDEYHALQVRVDQPNAMVRTTAGYYANAQKPAPGH